MTNEKRPPLPREGELYKRLEAFGKVFVLYYGYYEECDRTNPFCDPIPIYPDFLKEPIYTEEGAPFVTAVQDACIHYKGEESPNEDSTCAECKYFHQGEEWIGICACPKKKKS